MTTFQKLCMNLIKQTHQTLSFAAFLFITLVASSNADYLDRKAEGWHFYEDMNKKKPEEKDPGQSEQLPIDPEKQMEIFRKEVERLKTVAVMDPTRENVQAYMTIQKELIEKASRFASRWMEVVYTTPELDYTIKHPTSQTARHVYLDQKQHHMDQAVRKLSQTHGLFFFFSNSCAYCKKFAPVVKAFAQKYGWEVMAISTDGSTLPEFPNAVRDNGTAQLLGIEFVPTLLAVDPRNERVIPLSYGMSSQDQILDRIRVLIMEKNDQ